MGRLGGRANGVPDHESLNFRVGPYANTSKGPICEKKEFALKMEPRRSTKRKQLNVRLLLQGGNVKEQEEGFVVPTAGIFISALVYFSRPQN